MAFTQRKSIHGRELGISSTGGIISAPKGETSFDRAAQMWGSGMLETLSTVGAIKNYGISVLSSGSTSGTAPWTLGPPAVGLYKEIIFATSSTRIVINSTATTILMAVASSLAISSTVGATTIDISSSAVGTAGTIILRGRSATQWILSSKSPQLVVA